MTPPQRATSNLDDAMPPTVTMPLRQTKRQRLWRQRLYVRSSNVAGYCQIIWDWCASPLRMPNTLSVFWEKLRECNLLIMGVASRSSSHKVLPFKMQHLLWSHYHLLSRTLQYVWVKIVTCPVCVEQWYGLMALILLMSSLSMLSGWACLSHINK